MCNKPMDQRTVAYLNRQQQLTMNSKCIIEPFKTSASTINQIKDALQQINSFPPDEDKPIKPIKSRTSRY